MATIRTHTHIHSRAHSNTEPENVPHIGMWPGLHGAPHADCKRLLYTNTLAHNTDLVASRARAQLTTTTAVPTLNHTNAHGLVYACACGPVVRSTVVVRLNSARCCYLRERRTDDGCAARRFRWYISVRIALRQKCSGKIPHLSHLTRCVRAHAWESGLLSVSNPASYAIGARAPATLR